MVDLKQAELLLKRFEEISLLALGDVYLDEYVLGRVTQISEEAPVPVFVHKESLFTPGAMANVANNVRSLGADVELIGVLGRDEAGKQALRELKDRKIGSKGLFIDESRPTTHKVKYLAGSDERSYQHVFRFDKESRSPLHAPLERQVLRFLKDYLPSVHGMIVSDYRNGVVTEKILRECIRLGKRGKKIVTADSRGNLLDYEGVTAITPNRAEVAVSCKRPVVTDEDVCREGKHFRERLKAEAFIITCGKDGMWIFEKRKRPLHIPALKVEEVADVTGAGDTVLATLTVALAAGADMALAASLANVAAGLVVKKLGAATVNRGEILEALSLTHR